MTRIRIRQSSLTRAFAALRRAGYYAKQNWWCCQTCGTANVPDLYADKYVFYHAQDAEHLKESGETYLSWAGDQRAICAIFNRYGIETIRPKDHRTRIKIIVHDKVVIPRSEAPAVVIDMMKSISKVMRDEAKKRST